MTRPYFIFILSLVPSLSFAQGPSVVHRFNCTVDIRPAEKFVRAAIASLDPQAMVSIHETQLKVRMDSRILPTRTETTLNRLEQGTFTLEPSHRSLKEGTLDVHSPFPQYLDTGNPEADEAAFEQAKQAWRLANPEAHDALRQAQRNTQPVPYE